MQHPYRKYLERRNVEFERHVEQLQRNFQAIYDNNILIRSYSRDALDFPATSRVVEFATGQPREHRKKNVTMAEFMTGQPHESHGRREPIVKRSVRGWFLPNAFLVSEGDDSITTPVIFTAKGTFYKSYVPSPADPHGTFGVHTSDGMPYEKVFPIYATSTDELYRFFQGDRREEARQHLGTAMLQLSLGIR